MAYRVEVQPAARKAIRGFSRAVQAMILAELDQLQEEPRPAPPRGLKLTDRDAYRLRVRDYRIVYRIDDTNRQVTIEWVGLRRDAYRG